MHWWGQNKQNEYSEKWRKDQENNLLTVENYPAMSYRDFSIVKCVLAKNWLAVLCKNAFDYRQNVYKCMYTNINKNHVSHDVLTKEVYGASISKNKH